MKKQTEPRRFEAKEQTIYRDLKATIVKMNATSLRVDHDLLGRSVTVAIYFDRAGRRYVSQCSTWPNILDNLRAAQLAIEHTYRIAESYGVIFDQERGATQEMFIRAFAALEAPLDPNVLLLGSGSNWWDVLGVAPQATKAEIVNAYKALAKVHHPDAGGSSADFQRLRAAYEEGIKGKP